MTTVAALIGLALAMQAAPDVAPTGAGTITVALSPDAAIDAPAATALAEGVGDALAEANFLVLPGQGVGRYTAIVSLDRRVQGAVAATGSTPARPLTGVGNWGARASFALPTRKQGVHDLVMSTLTLRIVSRADGHAIWSGSALTAQVDGTADDAPQALGRKLARALMTRYPQPVDAIVSVP